ncbi:uncharacterized protein Z518_05187 [Rhinocladiella mackenziei CBS 650.93]|uniref:Rhinocladiella mackenziei CBS 650.93 unplaced genomic scaffold supercont1.4, whole genome shotgun sequence n=1 Tax=Rhinocladiella mackenziei CBS 650.93 TaxID=1442369 RepID=A0A0D2J5J2_9EURO|nr:uncharacterized protein Z518_05187 [Rhinocladiella mackenziei CBS 650.93]KIX04320.1 hypothetical protein Z518_05187 [Rhinocladiella mackenziei CBS 650.93]
MYSIVPFLVASGLITVAQAYTKPTEATWGPLLTPDLSNSVTQGQEFTVTWDPEDHPTDGVTVSLVLCHGPSSNCVPSDDAIASGIPADQKSFKWEVPCDLATGTAGTDNGYGMLIIVDGTGEFQYSTQFSCLAGKACSISSASSSSKSTAVTSTADNGSIILGPPAQQTGTWSSLSNSTTTYTGSGWSSATATLTAGSTGYTFGGSPSTFTTVSGTTVNGASTASTAPAETTVVAGGSTESASAPAASASTFGGGAPQVGWNAAVAVVAGAAALFAF